MRARFIEAAADDLDGIAEHISQDSPRAALRLVRATRKRIGLMAESGLAASGRSGRLTGTREIVVGAYIVVYRHDPVRDEIVVLSVTHGALRR